MSKIKKAIIIIMIVMYALIFAVCSYILVNNVMDYKEIINENTKLIDETIEVKVNSEYEKNMLIDWEKLANINQDIIGWIKIEDTKIDYPILQDKDLYYMNHTYEKNYNINGSIFTKIHNPFQNKETVIYGHNNRNGLMLADIEKFMDEEFFNNHQTFKIYTKTANYEARIFSIYSIGVNEESNNIKDLDFNELVEYYKNQSKFKMGDINISDKIVKISTCSYLNNKSIPTNQRYYLVAFLEEIIEW